MCDILGLFHFDRVCLLLVRDDNIVEEFCVLIPFKLRIYRNKKYLFAFFFKIKINRNDAMLDFSFLNKAKNLHFLYSKF
jgi:hypothetical protein